MEALSRGAEPKISLLTKMVESESCRFFTRIVRNIKEVNANYSKICEQLDPGDNPRNAVKSTDLVRGLNSVLSELPVLDNTLDTIGMWTNLLSKSSGEGVSTVASAGLRRLRLAFLFSNERR